MINIYLIHTFSKFIVHCLTNLIKKIFLKTIKKLLILVYILRVNDIPVTINHRDDTMGFTIRRFQL